MAAAAEKRVIVNADDFGFSPGVSAGIVRACREGIVTSTTLTANMPAAGEALSLLAETPGLGVGVHLNACQGPPLSEPARALLADDDGQMNWTAPRLLRACLFSRRRAEAVAAEFEAQIQWALDHGIAPTHLDSHRHIHGWPAFFTRVTALAERYNIRFVRRPVEKLPGGPWPRAPRKQRRVRWLLNLLEPLRGPSERVVTTGTWGIAHTGAIDATWLTRAAASVPPGVTEWMVHPGQADDMPAGQTRLRAGREAELAALCDPAVADAFGAQGVELTHYGRL